MKVKAILKYQYKQLKDKILSNEESARGKVLDKIIKDTDPYVPCDTGELADSAIKNVKASSIAYPVEYASYAFDPIAPSGVAKEYNTSKHPLAQGYPLEASFEEHGEEWNKFFLEELLRDVE